MEPTLRYTGGWGRWCEGLIAGKQKGDRIHYRGALRQNLNDIYLVGLFIFLIGLFN